MVDTIKIDIENNSAKQLRKILRTDPDSRTTDDIRMIENLVEVRIITLIDTMCHRTTSS